jgi:hypothetical protein
MIRRGELVQFIDVQTLSLTLWCFIQIKQFLVKDDIIVDSETSMVVFCIDKIVFSERRYYCR